MFCFMHICLNCEVKTIIVEAAVIGQQLSTSAFICQQLSTSAASCNIIFIQFRTFGGLFCVGEIMNTSAVFLGSSYIT